ncbi:MAG: carbamoyltransferase HypF [Fimbriimonadales bacterium]|nr:carbamoyltransferase HypF [Fimbriimonadales bacterium]
MRPPPEDRLSRRRWVLRGFVQGVGFRPYVHRLAQSLGLAGWVENGPFGVIVEVEGSASALREFDERLPREAPPSAWIALGEQWELEPLGERGFRIRPSREEGETSALALPDLAVCADCLREVFDPRDRRHRYPFANCTRCGPRYTILLRLPYDRANTTMARFALCAECRSEYEDPDDRRFHAQPIACPRCGPRLRALDPCGGELARDEEALQVAEEAVRNGRIVALKGLGGYQLIVDARNQDAVLRLRARKCREHKPFALLVASLDAARELAEVGALEAEALASPAAPIVLVSRRSAAPVAEAVAPDNPLLALMLPCTPLHALLASDLGFPAVATSGNRSDEPICIDEAEALARLGDIADLFLTHDRPIHRHMDDSVVRLAAGRVLVLRRARGYAPAPVPLPEASAPVLACGAHLKSTVCLAVRGWAFLSQHIGDLETPEAEAALRRVARELPELYRAEPEETARDLHPDYSSTRLAEESGKPVAAVQHHLAHALAVLAENSVEGPALAVAWDGTGLGTDRSVWGGEFFVVEGRNARRVASLRPFRLPGGDAAARDARRTALALWWASHGERSLPPIEFAPPATAGEIEGWRAVWASVALSPRCSSAGRLFDAASALCRLGGVQRYEGELPMLLEHRCGGRWEEGPRLRVVDEGILLLDWAPLLDMLVDETLTVETRARRFHGSLAAAISEVALAVGVGTVALGGGCFQNRVLLESAVELLRSAGFRAVWSQRVPPNDGGLSLGQAVAAVRRVRLVD